jgi:GH15 family glucan-1,4-alpha-glucosidase
MARYLPIAEHGLIGDLQSAALVGTDGTIDWYCCPRFDSPSVFAAILDADHGGLFRIAPDGGGWSSKQLYLPDTNVLITRFLTPAGVGEVQDFMPPLQNRLIRRIVVVRGDMRFVVELAPRFDYARRSHDVALTSHGAVFSSDGLTLGLSTPCPLDVAGDRDVRACVELRSGETAAFALEPRQPPAPFTDEDIAAEFDGTVDFWRSWLRGSRYSGRWRETVHRSALTLKLLTYAPTGAIVAAPTTSLPEEVGGARNWDYRYTWMRDAAFSLYALLRLGFTEEAGAFMTWLEGRFRNAPDRESGPLQIMYGIDGREDLAEEELSHLEGYQGSAPVRIGNGAATQLQLDIYGELMDSVYLCNKYGRPIFHDGWMQLTRNLEWLMDHWDQPDEGIWETRGGRKDFTTLDAISAELVSDSLVYRYDTDASPDGVAGKEATFSLCSFWWVEALARAGRIDDARLAFEKMLTYSNHVGLYSEEIGPTGEQLGNFPQAFTHLALISAAFNLDREIG